MVLLSVGTSVAQHLVTSPDCPGQDQLIYWAGGVAHCFFCLLSAPSSLTQTTEIIDRDGSPLVWLRATARQDNSKEKFRDFLLENLR